MNAIQVNPKKEKTISKKKQSPQSLHIIIIFLLNTKESKNHTLKKTVGVWVSNLKAENATWSQLSILYKIKTGSKLILKKEQRTKVKQLGFQGFFQLFIFNQKKKHKGKQKPYLKENRGCMGFELEGRKRYLESAFNPV